MVKYADNLYKGFGHAFSLVICSSISNVLFEDTAVNETFLTGSFLVIASSAAFSTVAQPGKKEGKRCVFVYIISYCVACFALSLRMCNFFCGRCLRTCVIVAMLTILTSNCKFCETTC